MHCRVTGKSRSGLLHFCMQTPFKWITKLQDMVEAATYGSELTSGRTGVDHIFGYRGMLRAIFR